MCSLSRLGWTMPAAHNVVDELGYSWDCRLDSPATILQAGHRSVQAWRLARICKALPDLLAEACEAGDASVAGKSFAVSFPDILACVSKAKNVRVCPLWEPHCRPSLISAVSGGQWPQARRHAVKRWECPDNRCQLCLREVGTLLHRHACSSIRPAQGWDPPPNSAALAIASLGGRRKELLVTRGLLVLRLPLPPVQPESFEWLWHIDEIWPEDTTWYIDGSMFDKEIWALRSVGFGIVVVSKSIGLIAFGGGHPPFWVKSAPAAEAWALSTVVQIHPTVPMIRTDCKNLLACAAAGLQKVTGPKMHLARIWHQIGHCLDGDLAVLSQCLSWMPAHISLAMIAYQSISDGKALTTVDWRANRLVDAIAKAFARDFRPPKHIRDHVQSARAMYKHATALLGVVTHRANHHTVQVLRADGSLADKTVRDAVDDRPKPHRRGRKRLTSDTIVPQQPSASSSSLLSTPAATEGSAPNTVLPVPISERQLTKRRATAECRARSSATDQTFLDRRVAEVSAALRPSSQLSGWSRLEAVRHRIISRQRLN